MDFAINGFEVLGSAPRLAIREDRKKDDDAEILAATWDTVSISDEARERLQAAASGKSEDKLEEKHGDDAASSGPGKKGVYAHGADNGEGAEDSSSRVNQLLKQIADVQKRLQDAQGRLAEAQAQAGGEPGGGMGASPAQGGRPGSAAAPEAENAENPEAGAAGAAPQQRLLASSLGGAEAAVEVKSIMQEISNLNAELLQLQSELEKAMKDGGGGGAPSAGSGGGYFGENRGAMGVEIRA